MISGDDLPSIKSCRYGLDIVLHYKQNMHFCQQLCKIQHHNHLYSWIVRSDLDIVLFHTIYRNFVQFRLGKR